MQLQRAFGLDFLPDPAFCWWFGGFVDGEGYFQASLRIGDNGWYKLTTRLGIGLRDDDIDVLIHIRQVLGIGTIWRQRRSGPQHNKATWQTSTLNDCQHIIVPLFEKYPLRAKKANDFEIWKRCVEVQTQFQQLIHLPGIYKQDTIDEFQELCLELKNGRQYKYIPEKV